MPPIDRIYAGAAVVTVAQGVWTPTSPGVGNTFTVADPTGWPSSGIFPAKLDKGLSTEEHIICTRSGSTYTVQQRGYDGTSAQSHSDPSIELYWDARTANLVVDHIDGVEANPHAGVLLTEVDHAGIVHDQSMLGTDSVGAAQIQTNAVGANELADNAVDTAAIANLAVTAGKIANDTITATQIAADAIGSSELANNAVDAAAIAAGAVIAGKIGVGGVSATDQLADAIVTLAKLASEGSSSFTPTFECLGAVTLGVGGSSYGRYFKLGRIVVGIAGFFLGTGGNVPGSDPNLLRLTLPFPVKNDTSLAGSNSGWITAARAYDASADATFSGLGILRSSDDIAFAWITAGASAEWDGLTPFNWDVNDIFQCLFVYEAES